MSMFSDAYHANDLMQWRDIDTAPKDGSKFLGYVDGDVRFVAWTKTSHVPLYGFCTVDEGWESSLCHPAHWMPLPEPPDDAN